MKERRLERHNFDAAENPNLCDVKAEICSRQLTSFGYYWPHIQKTD